MSKADLDRLKAKSISDCVFHSSGAVQCVIEHLVFPASFAGLLVDGSLVDKGEGTRSTFILKV